MLQSLMKPSKSFKDTHRRTKMVVIAGMMTIATAAYFHTNSTLQKNKHEEVSAIAAAVGAGPVNLLSLQAVSMGQEQLDQMMVQLNAAHRDLIGIDVYGGPKGTDRYIGWSTGKKYSKTCMETRTFSSRPLNSLYDFVTKITFDRCLLGRKAAVLWIPLGVVVLLISGVFIGTIFQIYRPLLDSVRAAQDVIRDKVLIRSSEVRFQPIQDLMHEAIRAQTLQQFEQTAQMAEQVAHDIRSPLAALSLLQQHFTCLPDEVAEVGMSAISRVRSIVSDLSIKGQTAKQNAEDLVQQPQSCGDVFLDSLIEAIVKEKKLQLDTHKIKITHEYQCCGIKVTDASAEAQLQRVVSNLISNAIEAIDAIGEIYVRVTAPVRSDHVEIMIEDTGKGIPQDLAVRLGSRGYSHGKSGESGRGLGVWHAMATIGNMGGNVTYATRLDSRRPSGTLAIVRLPLGLTLMRIS